MEVDIEEDENEPELTYPYEGMDPLNTPSLASESEPEDAIEVENPIDHEDETVLASVYEVGELSTSSFLRENSDGLLLSLMRRDINSLFGHMASLSRRLGFVFEERPNEAINVPIKDEKSPSSEIMPPKSAPMTQAAIHRMIKENVDAAIAAERARHANVGTDARGPGLVRGQDVAPAA
nr:hypothetical protein [Tanacetum cinerariifolium]